MTADCHRDALVSGANGIIAHYERHARDWDADRNRHVDPWNDKVWHERFVAALPNAAVVLDLGCGAGLPVADYLASKGCSITGVDPSPTLVDLARERLPAHRWIVGDMRALDLGARFDGILAWDSLFHLPPDDQRGMFDVFDRNAAASAVLMFNAGPGEAEILGSYRGDALYHASLAAEEYNALLDRIGFQIRTHVVADKQAGGRTVWLAVRSQPS